MIHRRDRKNIAPRLAAYACHERLPAHALMFYAVPTVLNTALQHHSALHCIALPTPLSGLAYAAGRLAGIVAISGWCTDRKSFGSSVHPAQLQTPLFFTCGTGDPVVSFKLTKVSGELLASTLNTDRAHEHVVTRHQQRTAHPPKRAEMQAAELFIRDCLA